MAAICLVIASSANAAPPLMAYGEHSAADGLSIPAYLTLPLGRPPKALSLVVLVHGGPQARDDPGFDWISQAFASRTRHADKAAVPILLVHGLDDTVVRYNQSQHMADALKRAGKPYEFVTLKGEDHWGSRSETRLQLMQAWMTFLEAHNPPEPPLTKTADAGIASLAVSH